MLEVMEPPVTSLDKTSDAWNAVLKWAGPKVYILRCNEFFKIGLTRGSITSRVDTLQVGNPYIIELVFCIPTAKPEELEKLLHARFNASRGIREWFKLSKEDFELLEKDLPDIFKMLRYGDPKTESSSK